MKRTLGAYLLLAGLTGCVTFGNNAQGDKKLPDTKAVSGLTPGPALTGMPVAMPAAMPAWSGQPGQQVPGPVVVARAPSLPPSLMPAPTPDLKPVPTRPAMPPEMPPGMPVASTPRPEPKPDTRPAGFVAASEPRSEPKLPEIISGGVPELVRPAVVSKKPAEEPPVRPVTAKLGGAPMLRLVNTKRITLNFEIAEVGTSGLSAVDLWYTQDGRAWKKHEAPTDPRAYVVEVDEEGMYGFTLVARSGIGLGQEPPAPGDQPQVWVIVDLSKPDVQLQEVAATYKSKLQEVAIRWSATDKNLGRGPVTLSYAETDEGPWTVIATNLDGVGSYCWKVPAGVPPQVLLRAEAADLAGNVGRARSSRPIVMDASMPKVSIVNVEANGTK